METKPLKRASKMEKKKPEEVRGAQETSSVYFGNPRSLYRERRQRTLLQIIKERFNESSEKFKLRQKIRRLRNEKRRERRKIKRKLGSGALENISTKD